MSEQPYDVDTDLGDDPQESAIAETESGIDPEYNIVEYSFVDDDSRGELGISDEVRAERQGVVPRQDWGGGRSAEQEALSVVPESEIAGEPDTASGNEVS
ncbi:hypothetical protein [Nocardiopsis sp. LOL_012]|uniref:hypothetical protein n=1 Tax=Nocardiopsis sp. LOL_012 TaxID=3345409 RepID=UPI003A838170